VKAVAARKWRLEGILFRPAHQLVLWQDSNARWADWLRSVL
jgi:hypothetical protein